MADSTPATDWQLQRDACKAEADQYFRKGQYDSAIREYTRALSLDPENATLLSNRSAAHLKHQERSKALHDAQACVKIGTMGLKGISRLAAALQALGRYEAALVEWKKILQSQSDHPAAKAGKAECLKHLDTKEPDDDDDLDDFFDQVEDAVQDVAQAKQAGADKVASHKKDLGSAEQQVHRILPLNHQWYNLNPFRVLDIAHTASRDDISRRFKALSLLLHPDKNPNLDRAQEAYDQVLKAKELLYDEEKRAHYKNLVQEGVKQGLADYEQSNKAFTKQEYQDKAIARVFADIEQRRRRIEHNEKSFAERERKFEDELNEKQVKDRKFQKEFRSGDRQDKRVGNWRDFQNKKHKSS